MVSGLYFLPKKLGKIIGSNRLNLPYLWGRYEKNLRQFSFSPPPLHEVGRECGVVSD